MKSSSRRLKAVFLPISSRISTDAKYVPAAFGPARRSHYLFHYIIQGSARLPQSTNQSQAFYDIRAGEGVHIFPGADPTYVADLIDPWEYIWIEFDGSHR